MQAVEDLSLQAFSSSSLSLPSQTLKRLDLQVSYLYNCPKPYMFFNELCKQLKLYFFL